MLKTIIAIWIPCSILAVFVSGCAKQPDVVLIGECSPLHGKSAGDGSSMHEGIILAVEEINNRGGILNKKVELRQEDDGSDGNEARSAVEKLIKHDGVSAILGEVTSSNTIIAAPVAQMSKIPLISPAATSPEVTKIGDYVFRVCFTDDFQGAACAAFASNTLEAKKAGVLMDSNSEYSKGLAKSFSKAFQSGGGKVVVSQSYSAGDTDFEPQLASIKEAKPDILFLPGCPKEVSIIAVQARRVGIRAPLLGGDGWDSPLLVSEAGRSLEGCYFSNHFSSLGDEPAVRQFVAAFRDKYNKDPNAIAALGYDATWILAEAIKRAGSTDGDAIRRAMRETRDYPGVTGQITIDGRRNARKPAVILQVKGGQFVPIATITPDNLR